MRKVLISGCSGKMGRVIASVIDSREDCKTVAGVDLFTQPYGDFPIYKTFDQVEGDVDVIIDFSNPAALDGLLTYAVNKKVPVVVSTTGFTKEQIQQIHEAAEKIPVFFSFNMSLGINLLVELSKKAAQVLGGQFDIEIVEKHHNQKIDAPSGTAIMLADAINHTLNDQYRYVYDRHSQRKKRDKNEIGMHSVRGGTIVGEHEVIFAGRDEVITLSHSAFSKEVFAVGSVNAAMFLADKGPGLYQMSDLL